MSPWFPLKCARPASKPSAQPSYPRKNLTTGYAWILHGRRVPRNSSGAQWPGLRSTPRDRCGHLTAGTCPYKCMRPRGNSFAPGARASFGSRTRCASTARATCGWSIVGCTSCGSTPGGELLLTLGTPGEPGEDSTHFNRPTDVAVTSRGEIFVTDGYGNNRVVHFDARGEFVRTWGELGVGPGQFSLPHSIAADSRGRLYVADRNNARVQVFDQAGRFLAEWRDLLVPWHIVVTEHDEIYVCGSSPMCWPKLQLIPGLVVGIPPKDQLVMVLTPDGRVDAALDLP